MFGKKLRVLMAYEDIKQRELAEILGISQVTVSEWLKEKKMPSLNKMKKLADYFDTSIDLLMDNKDPKQGSGKTIKDLTENNLSLDLDEELFKALESLPAEFKQDLLDVAEKLNEKVKTIERKISKRRPK